MQGGLVSISQVIKEKTSHARTLVFLSPFLKTGNIIFWLNLGPDAATDRQHNHNKSPPTNFVIII